MRLSTRSSVDLPQPDGPMKAVTLLAIERQADVLQRARVAVIEVEIADRRSFLQAGRIGRRVGDRAGLGGSGATLAHVFLGAASARAHDAEREHGEA